MKISVITVCFNAESTIAHTIESVLRQDHPSIELLVIDGASRDGTVKLVESFADPRILIYSRPDKGIYDAMNRGLELYRGDAVGFLNADDCYADDSVLSAIANSLNVSDIVSANLDFVNDHDDSRVLREWRGSGYVSGAFKSGWMPAHPTFYVKRKVVDAVGRFDLDYRIAADYDFMLRAFELNAFTSWHLDKTLVHMKVGGKSTAGLKAYMKSNLESLRSRRRWLNSGVVDYALFAKPLRKLGQFKLPGARS